MAVQRSLARGAGKAMRFIKTVRAGGEVPSMAHSRFDHAIRIVTDPPHQETFMRNTFVYLRP
jgi:hypothetical protein